MITIPREHDEWRDQAACYVLGALTPDERHAFESHLATCAECAAEVRALTGIPHALAQVVPQFDPPPALRRRVLSAIGSAAHTPPLEAAPRGTFMPWLAAAAALIIAVGAAGYAVQLRTRIGDLEQRLRVALARADASDRLVADARRTAGEAETRLALLTAPDVMRVDLGGQAPAPRASGRAYWSRSRGLLFTAADLPALGPGRVYQLWILNGTAPPISNAWLLRPDAAGRIAVVFDTPVDVPRPTGLAVSIEPEGGVPSPTGALYLVGLAGRS
jgi:anti-sigma-K factor RskA